MAKNILDMSDEEFAKLTPDSPEYQELMAQTTEQTNVPDGGLDESEIPADEEDPATQPESEGEPETPDESEESEEESAPDAAEEPEGEPEAPAAPAKSDKPAKEAKQPEAPAVPEKPTAEVDYVEVGKRVLAPFKANGREIQVKSVDDAVRLMQMGANYNAKMAGLQPSLATLKLLERNNLLDNEQLNYLIDLHQKKPEAIAKLIKDAGIDPMDIDTSKDVVYSPTQRTVAREEVQLEQVLDDLRGSKHFTELCNVMGTQWDEQSRSTIAANPAILNLFHSHMEQGYFSKIMDVVQYERSFGRLAGMSDIEAYKHVGDELNARGEFTAPNTASPEKPTVPAKPNTVRQTVTKPAVETDPAKIARRKAAASTAAIPGKAKQVINPLELSDEEFLKLGGVNYLNQ